MAVAGVATVGLLMGAGCARTGPSAGGGHPTAAAAAGSGASSGASTGQIVARPIAPYGTVLTNARGYALYVFAPDDGQRVTCTGSCAGDWPPVYGSGNVKGLAGAGIDGSQLGLDPDPDGKQVVTYHGWPLYSYVADPAPGYANGEGLDDDGGYWYLITAAGQVVKASY